MRVEQTESFIFYHGTGRTAARAILTAGSKDSHLQEIGAFELGREIWKTLLFRAGLEEHEYARLHQLKGPGAEYSDLWIPAFRHLASGGSSHFDYGFFFATLNIANAYRYARNPYRSEFIRAIAESLKLLSHLGDPLPQRLAANYPRVAKAIHKPSLPVVLELTGICRERLVTAEGSPDVESALELWRDMEPYSGVNMPADFRISEVGPADIAAVHDLSNWQLETIDNSLRPSDTNVVAARFSVHDWLLKVERHDTDLS